MHLTQGCHRAIMLQELATTNGNPARLQEWVAMARQISGQYS